MTWLRKFLVESNKIESVSTVSDTEVQVAEAFLEMPTIHIADLVSFVKTTQPDAVLRDKQGLDVIVGDHRPPRGGPHLRNELELLLIRINSGEIDAYRAHIEYERLHPFTDGNGRSGRMLWLWQMKKAPLGFLHTFYYQVLRAS